MARPDKTPADNEAQARQERVPDGAARAAAAPPSGERAQDLAADGLEDLDLRIEKVEERISPSETNVFDK